MQGKLFLTDVFDSAYFFILFFLLNVIRHISHSEYRTGMCCPDM